VTFEEWYRTTDDLPDIEDPRERVRLQAAWDAATYAANNAQGVAANEAEKDARLEKAIAQYCGLPRRATEEDLRAIIKAAQG
jgi:hypothetical protein